MIYGDINTNNKTIISLSELKKYTHENDKIKFMGKTDNILTVLSKVDVMVLPSYREGLSKALLEAASMQLPIITTNVPGCKDVVEDNVNGLLCEPKSIESLKNSMIKMINFSESERIEMGQAGRKIIVKKFSSKIINNIYTTKIYNICGLHK